MCVRTSIANKKDKSHTASLCDTKSSPWKPLAFHFLSIYIFVFKSCLWVVRLTLSRPQVCPSSGGPVDTGADPGCCEATWGTAEAGGDSDAML